MTQNKGILVIVEAENGIPSQVTAELFGAANLISGNTNEPLNAFVIGYSADAAAKTLERYGVSTAFSYETPDPTPALAAVASKDAIDRSSPRVIIVAETDFGRDLAPMLAGSLNSAAV